VVLSLSLLTGFLHPYLVFWDPSTTVLQHVVDCVPTILVKALGGCGWSPSFTCSVAGREGIEGCVPGAMGAVLDRGLGGAAVGGVVELSVGGGAVWQKNQYICGV